MRNEFVKRLYLRYPDLFRKTGTSNGARARYMKIQCGNGWLPLIDVLSEAVVKLGKNTTDFKVYERFSRLEISCPGMEDLALSTIIWAAEAFSVRVCPVTGLPADPVTADALWFKIMPPQALARKAAKSGQFSDQTYLKYAGDYRVEHLMRKDIPPMQARRFWTKYQAEEFLRTWVPCIDSINIRPVDFDLVDAITRIMVTRYSPHDDQFWSAATKFLSITWTDDSGLTFDVNEDALRSCDPKEFDIAVNCKKEGNQGSWLDLVTKVLRTQVDAVNIFSSAMSKKVDHSALNQSMMMEISTLAKVEGLSC
jgi:hypothetical protein